MKTAEELNTLKEEVETLNSKLRELTEEELRQVTGGVVENDGDKATITTTKAYIENEASIINYEGRSR